MYRTALRRLALSTWLSILVACSTETGSSDEQLRLNQIQTLGTHNSFHPHPDSGPIQGIIEERFNWFVGQGEYRHAPLTTQLVAQGMRHFELDVFADPAGGNFSHRPLLATIGEDPERNIAALEQPGFKVLHLPQIDPDSSCWTLVQCLTEIRSWSDTHPGHLPLMVMIETKFVDFLGLATYIPITPFDKQDYRALDQEILSVFPRQRLITPEDVQGQYPSLEQAVLEQGWPTLAESRGKVLFTQYHGHNHPSLKGRVMFPDSQPGQANAAFMVLEDAVSDYQRIQSLVKKGYLVRTRSDIDLREAHNNDYSRFEKALASGAQFISTDIAQPYEDINPDFVIAMPGGDIARCNPLNAPQWCRSGDITESAP